MSLRSPPGLDTEGDTNDENSSSDRSIVSSRRNDKRKRISSYDSSSRPSKDDQRRKSVVSNTSTSSTTHEIPSLRDEINKSLRKNEKFNINANMGNRIRNVVTKYSSHDEREKDSNEEFVNKSKREENFCRHLKSVNEFPDSATESEFAAYTPGSLPNKVRFTFSSKWY